MEKRHKEWRRGKWLKKRKCVVNMLKTAGEFFTVPPVWKHFALQQSRVTRRKTKDETHNHVYLYAYVRKGNNLNRYIKCEWRGKGVANSFVEPYVQKCVCLVMCVRVLRCKYFERAGDSYRWKWNGKSPRSLTVYGTL